MIESGSLEPGIDPAAFRLPPGTALRYERPAEPLRPLLASYAVHDSDARVWPDQKSWKLPGSTQLWIGLPDASIVAKPRRRRAARVATAMICGTTSTVVPLTTGGGASIQVHFTGCGWMRYFEASAMDLCDQIVPLSSLWPDQWTQDLLALAPQLTDGANVKPVLDEFFLSRLPRPSKYEPRAARMAALLADPRMSESGQVAAGLGVSVPTLLRLSHRCLGYGPKLLIRRTRFLRVLASLLLADTEPNHSAVPLGYHDVPHFLRDARDFLGMTAREFLALPTGYLRAMLRARAQVIGSPLPVLDAVL